jgi:hypothetical protein
LGVIQLAKIYLLSGKSEKEEAFFNALSYPNISSESSYKICNFAIDTGHTELAIKGITISEEKFKEKW